MDPKQHEQGLGRISLNYSAIFFSVFLIPFVGSDSTLGYGLYLTPIVMLAELRIFTPALKVNRWPAIAALTLLVVGSFSLLFDQHSSVRILALLLLGVSALSIPSRTSTRSMAVVTITCFVCSLIVGREADESLDLIRGSTSAGEHALGLAVPLLALAFVARRQWFWAGFAIVATIIFFKRISWVALIVALTLSALWVSGSRESKIEAGLGFIRQVVVLIVMVAALQAQAFFLLLSDSLYSFTGLYIGANHLSSGRYDMMLFLEETFNQLTLSEKFFGLGVGASVSEIELAKGNQLHNDYVRILLEFGYLGLFLISLLLVNLCKLKGLRGALIVYTAFILFSDNILIYVFYWVVFIFCWNYPQNANGTSLSQ